MKTVQQKYRSDWHRAHEALTKSADGRVDDSLDPAQVVNTGRERSIRVFSFARIHQLWLAAAPVKAQDELAVLGLDRRLASRKSPDIRAKKNIRYELTQSQKLLTSTGLLMEGQRTHPG
jgi:hypothetical protein